MADFETTVEQVTRFPCLSRHVTLTEGQTIKDIPGVLEFAGKQVKAGTVADVVVLLKVKEIKTVSTDTTEFLGEPNE